MRSTRWAIATSTSSRRQRTKARRGARGNEADWILWKGADHESAKHFDMGGGRGGRVPGPRGGGASPERGAAGEHERGQRAGDRAGRVVAVAGDWRRGDALVRVWGGA